jgi:hypothetical protein
LNIVEKGLVLLSGLIIVAFACGVLFLQFVQVQPWLAYGIVAGGSCALLAFIVALVATKTDPMGPGPY